jgi:hypothetical protein
LTLRARKTARVPVAPAPSRRLGRAAAGRVMALVSQAEYARRRGLSKQAVHKRTADAGGPIPTHGRRKQIDETEADALYQASMRENGAANSRFRAPGDGVDPEGASSAGDGSSPGVLGSASTLWRARTAMLVTEAQLKRLQLEERRGLVVNRQTALAKAFAFARLIRDAILAWPASAGPELAAQFELDERAVTLVLEELLRGLLEQLSRERVDF